jgi:hypothetical protein
MAFDLRRLDTLNPDQAMPLLDSYIDDAIKTFLASNPGQTYAQASSDCGYWIGVFIETAYHHGRYTLAEMIKTQAKEVLEKTLPRELLLTDARDADDAIPELIAFWTFLKVTYKLKYAGTIVTYLKSIENDFAQWMFDPNRAGTTKTFLMQGRAAGYDMDTQAGLDAFKVVYNRRRQQQQQQQPALLP